MNNLDETPAMRPEIKVQSMLDNAELTRSPKVDGCSPLIVWELVEKKKVGEVAGLQRKK